MKPILIGLVGKAHSGKSTLTNYLRRYRFANVSMVSALRREVYEAIFLMDPGRVTPEFIAANKNVFRPMYTAHGRAMRFLHGRDCYARSAIEEVKDLLSCGHTRVSSDDMRMIFEADLWHEIGGLVVHLDCPDAIRRARLETHAGPLTDEDWFRQSTDETEAEVPLVPADYTIYTGGTIEEEIRDFESLLARLKDEGYDL